VSPVISELLVGYLPRREGCHGDQTRNSCAKKAATIFYAENIL
jgi:hypothetical protein